MRIREGFWLRSGCFPVGTCVPAGPQDASVRDAGHTGHWAQRVIEASPVQNGITQDGIGARDTVKAVWVLFLCVLFFPSECMG